MKTILSTLTPKFSFAGFSFPKHVWTLDGSPIAKRLAKRKPVVCGAYYHSPKPNSNDAMGFYLDSDGQPFSRWDWCDDVASSIRHTGWFCDDYCQDKIRGIVVRLSHGRFLAGYSMGEHMASAVFPEVFTDEIDAAHMADEHARCAADEARECREYQESREEEEE